MPAEIKVKSRTPAEIRGKSRTPAEIKGKSRTPAEIKGESRTPAEIKGESRTPAEIKAVSRTPAEIKGESRTPAEIKGESRTPAVNKTDSRMPAMINQSRKTLVVARPPVVSRMPLETKVLPPIKTKARHKKPLGIKMPTSKMLVGCRMLAGSQTPPGPAVLVQPSRQAPLES
jgi:hypothetical protein